MSDIFDELDMAEQERAAALSQAREDWARVLATPEGRRVALRLLQDFFLAVPLSCDAALLALRNYGVLLLKEIMLSCEPAGLELLLALFGNQEQPSANASADNLDTAMGSLK